MTKDEAQNLQDTAGSGHADGGAVCVSQRGGEGSHDNRN